MRLNDWKAAASVALLLVSTTNPQGFAQQQIVAQQVSPTAPAAPQAVTNDTTGQPGLPQAPQPKPTDPLYLRDTGRDYSRLKHFTLLNPVGQYTSTGFPLPSLSNTPRLDNLLQDGKIYLSLADAVTLETPQISVATRPRQPVSIDGDDAGRTPARFRIEPKALRVFVSADFPRDES